MEISKKDVVEGFLNMLQEKITEAEQVLEDTISSRDNESKSTAGEKYETGRAMAQIAQQQNEMQLSQLNSQFQRILQFDPLKIKNKVSFGSLVETDGGWFFISIGIGIISLKNIKIYGMSMSSPLGLLLNEKMVGDEVHLIKKLIKY